MVAKHSMLPASGPSVEADCGPRPRNFGLLPLKTEACEFDWMYAAGNERVYREVVPPGEGIQFVEEGKRKGSQGAKWCL